MKITSDHYNYMKQEIAKVWSKDKNDAHRQFIINEGKSKDVEKRLRFDWMYYAKLTPFICENVYKYADDTHINTALKSIMKELNQ